MLTNRLPQLNPERVYCDLMKDTHPADDDLSDLAHGPVWPCGFGELGQQVFVQRDVSIQVAEDVSELLFRHNGELQHRVVVRLWTGAEPTRSNNNTQQAESRDAKNN